MRKRGESQRLGVKLREIYTERGVEGMREKRRGERSKKKNQIKTDKNSKSSKRINLASSFADFFSMKT